MDETKVCDCCGDDCEKNLCPTCAADLNEIMNDLALEERMQEEREEVYYLQLEADLVAV